MKTLITGGLGFVGCHLAARLLDEGRDVVILDSLARPNVSRNLQWLESRSRGRLRFTQGDVRDARLVAGAMKDVRTVFHLAAQVAVTSSVADPVTDFAVNAQGTLNVLEAARQATPRPFVFYTSTNKVYGGMTHLRVVEAPTRHLLPDYPHGIPETFPLDLHSPYGCSKGAADQYVRDYHRIYGLPTVVFRMSCIYGPRQLGTEDQGWLAHFVLTALRGGHLTICGDGKQVRDLLYVDDLIAALLRAEERIDSIAGNIFNIGGGPTYALSIWAECSRVLEQVLGRVPPVSFGPWRPGDQRVYVSDVRRAKQTFDWEPRIPPAEGIAQLAAWAEEAVAVLKGSA